MFYCDECAHINYWPVTMFKSLGLCEECGRCRTCNEMKSDLLPLPKGAFGAK